MKESQAHIYLEQQDQGIREMGGYMANRGLNMHHQPHKKNERI